MTWTRLDEDFVDRPDLLDLSRSARLLHIEGMVWSNRHGTDGKIPSKVIRRLSDTEHLDAELDELEAAWLWLQAEDGSWQIEQWVDREHQERAADVALRRKGNANRQEAFRRRRAMHQAGDHSECVAKYCVESRGEKKPRSAGSSRPAAKQSTAKSRAATGCPHGGPAGHDDDGLPLCYECETAGEPSPAKSQEQGQTDRLFDEAATRLGVKPPMSPREPDWEAMEARARAQETRGVAPTTVEVIDVEVIRDEDDRRATA